MKHTGMVRPVDTLGRIVLPRELRKLLGIVDGKDSVEIFIDGDNIVLRKYQPSCIFCGEIENTVMLGNHLVCKKCVAKLSKLSK